MRSSFRARPNLRWRGSTGALRLFGGSARRRGCRRRAKHPTVRWTGSVDRPRFVCTCVPPSLRRRSRRRCARRSSSGSVGARVPNILSRWLRGLVAEAIRVAAARARAPRQGGDRCPGGAVELPLTPGSGTRRGARPPRQAQAVATRMASVSSRVWRALVEWVARSSREAAHAARDRRDGDARRNGCARKAPRRGRSTSCCATALPRNGVAA